MQPLTTLRMIRPFDDIAADASNKDMDPSSRLQDIRKRMRTGRHKYAVPGWDEDEIVPPSSSSSIFERPLLPIASPGQDDAAELVNLLRIREVCSQAQTSSTPTETPAVQAPLPPNHSPPPTPGRDHDNVSYPTEFPKFLPLGTSRPTEDNEVTDKAQNGPIEAKNIPLPRLKPAFTSSLLQDLISCHQSKTKGPNDNSISSSINKVPELPFHVGTANNTSSSSPSAPSGKTSAKMSTAMLPHRIQEIRERATAA